MYNRYIPQPDGSYRRSHVPDTPSRRPSPPPEIYENEPDIVCEQELPCKPEPEPRREHRIPPGKRYSVNRPNHRKEANRYRPAEKPCGKQAQSCEEKDGSVTNFFRQLLPKDFDTGDLLVVLLLLLMSGDCTEDQNSALLTLVLYLFM